MLATAITVLEWKSSRFRRSVYSRGTKNS